MTRPGRWISLPPILALVPRLGLSVLAADRQQVALETRALLLWSSSAALAVLVGFAEIYVGATVVSRRIPALPAFGRRFTVLLNALIVPLSLSGLQPEPFFGRSSAPPPSASPGVQGWACSRPSAASAAPWFYELIQDLPTPRPFFPRLAAHLRLSPRHQAPEQLSSMHTSW